MINPNFDLLKKIGTPNSRLFVTLASDASANHETELEVYQTEVFVDNNNSSYTETIKLPSIARARGLIYTIRVTDVGAGVSIVDRDDSIEWVDLTADADGEYVILYSNGNQWMKLATDIS